MIAATPTRTRRTLALGLALLLGGLFASHASAVAVCQKTSKKGKLSFKLREACLTDKGEVEVNVGTRTAAFHTSNEEQVTIDGDGIALPIDGTSDTFAFDTTSASSDVVVTFTASCSTIDETGAGWVDIDVNVDGATVSPTNLPTNAFCFETGINDEVRHTASYTVAVEDLAAGSHSIQVLANNESLTGGIVGFPILSAVSLVVTVHEN
jgi:hypothetical protein